MVGEDDTLLRSRSSKNVSADPDESVSLVLKRLLKPRPDKPCHKIRDSLFTSSSGSIDYTGIVIFGLILVALASAHITLESVIKYGILFDPVKFFSMFFYKPTESPSSLILLSLNIFALSSLGIEVLLYKGLFGEKVGLAIISALLISEIMIPPTLLYHADCHVLGAFFVMLFVIVVFLKLASYHITNLWCREAHVSTEKNRQVSVSSDTGNGSVETNFVKYPDNLNVTDLYYFLFAPTLCYELNFPRIAHIRKTFLVKRVLEMLFLALFNLFLIQQCIAAILNDSLKPIQERDYPRIFECLFKLAVPFMCIWLMVAYCGFHSYLNIIAEILRFGDRYFYCDFWNVGTVEDVWENWNICVHNWCVRYLYLPLRQWGFTNSQTSTVVFFISAVFHEYVFIVSFKMFGFWSFLVMLLQAPYIIFVDKYLHSKCGSIVGFFFFFIALPFCNLMYYYDYYMINYQNVEEAV